MTAFLVCSSFNRGHSQRAFGSVLNRSLCTLAIVIVVASGED